MQRTMISRGHAALEVSAMRVLFAREGVMRFDPESHVALFSLERHARKNAIGRQLLADMQHAIRVCTGKGEGQTPPVSVRCLVLESRVPGVFCAGADLKERATMPVEEARQFVDSLRSTFSEFEDLDIPTIAAIEGKALGGGMELALSVDIRVAGEEAVMGFPETGLAIIPGAGGTVRAPRLIGVSKALELILTADPVNAKAAQEMGLVNRTVKAGDATRTALDIALRIARNGPLGVRSAKKSVKEGCGLSRAAAMAKEHECYETVLASQDRLEGLAAFNEKREPKYKGC